MIFSSNSLRLYDIRRNSCTAWEPSVLVRKNFMDDNSSDPEEHLLSTSENSSHSVRSFDSSRRITVLTSSYDEDFFFCGREDGSVTIHYLKTGGIAWEMKLHSVEINYLDFNPKTNVLLSIDISKRC